MEYNKFAGNKPGRQIYTSSPADVRRRQKTKETNAALIEELKKELANLRGKFKADTGGLSPEEVDKEIRQAVKSAVKETKAYYEPLLSESKARENTLRENVRELKNKLADSLAEANKEHERDTEKAVRNLEERYNGKLSNLEDKLKLAQDKIEEKNDEIEHLKSERDDTIKRLLEEHTKKLEEITRTMSMEKTGVDDPNRPKMEEVFIDPLEEGEGSDLESHIKLEDVSSGKKDEMKNKVDKLKNLMGRFADKED